MKKIDGPTEFPDQELSMDLDNHSGDFKDWNSIAKKQLDDLLDGADGKWHSDNKLFIIVDKGGIRHIVLRHFDTRIIKYKKRNNHWVWISVENIFGRVKLAKDVEADNVRRLCLGLMRHFK